ncbi:sulfite oxidase [Aureococcus anophagefferens]|nr:sulfite oxidase [Aureococcus anophagefferens]
MIVALFIAAAGAQESRSRVYAASLAYARAHPEDDCKGSSRRPANVRTGPTPGRRSRRSPRPTACCRGAERRRRGHRRRDLRRLALRGRRRRRCGRYAVDVSGVFAGAGALDYFAKHFVRGSPAGTVDVYAHLLATGAERPEAVGDELRRVLGSALRAARVEPYPAPGLNASTLQVAANRLGRNANAFAWLEEVFDPENTHRRPRDNKRPGLANTLSMWRNVYLASVLRRASACAYAVVARARPDVRLYQPLDLGQWVDGGESLHVASYAASCRTTCSDRRVTRWPAGACWLDDMVAVGPAEAVDAYERLFPSLATFLWWFPAHVATALNQFPERLALAHADWLAKSGRNFRWDLSAERLDLRLDDAPDHGALARVGKRRSSSDISDQRSSGCRAASSSSSLSTGASGGGDVVCRARLADRSSTSPRDARSGASASRRAAHWRAAAGGGGAAAGGSDGGSGGGGVAAIFDTALSNERLVSSDELASHDERLVSSDELASHDFTPVAEGGSGRLWVSYKRGVYDVTDWAAQHPGGLANLKMAAGGPSDAYWAHWSCVQDPSAALPVLEKYRVGRLAEDEEDDDDDPYADEPDRAARIAAGLRPLKAGAGGKATGPFEAECDVPGLSFLTPADIFYVRNHAPAPPEDAPAFASASPAAPASACASALRRGDFGPVVSLPVTVQCSGNRLREAAPPSAASTAGRAAGRATASSRRRRGRRAPRGRLGGDGRARRVRRRLARRGDGPRRLRELRPLRDVASNDALLAFG